MRLGSEEGRTMKSVFALRRPDLKDLAAQTRHRREETPPESSFPKSHKIAMTAERQKDEKKIHKKSNLGSMIARGVGEDDQT